MESETFVGLDVHKNLVVATAVDSSGRTLSQVKLGSSDRELVEYLGGLPGSKRVALEACSVWEHYHDAAVSAGAQVVLSMRYRISPVFQSDRRAVYPSLPRNCLYAWIRRRPFGRFVSSMS